jgi:hypothetical protein
MPNGRPVFFFGDVSTSNSDPAADAGDGRSWPLHGRLQSQPTLTEEVEGIELDDVYDGCLTEFAEDMIQIKHRNCILFISEFEYCSAFAFQLGRRVKLCQNVDRESVAVWQ